MRGPLRLAVTVRHLHKLTGTSTECYRRHLEANSSLLAGSASTVSVGIGCGVIPAATVAAITNVHDLVRIGPSIVLLSLRLALSISNRTRAIEDEARTVSSFLPGLAPKECFVILEEFNRVNVDGVSPFLQFSADMILECSSLQKSGY